MVILLLSLLWAGAFAMAMCAAQVRTVRTADIGRPLLTIQKTTRGLTARGASGSIRVKSV